MSGKNVVIAGATGMVGGRALRLCLINPRVSRVTVIGRRTTGLNNSKLKEVLHQKFMDFTAITDVLKNQDIAIYCLGAYTGAVTDEQFKQITLDYTLAFATALHKINPRATFCFLSGQGADQTEKSRMSFARYKGAAEKGLLAMDFPRLHIFRPGYIYPVSKRKEPNRIYHITRALYPILRRVYPNIGISSEDLACAMIQAGLHGTGEHQNPVLENREIKSLIL